jgi:MFS family permease
MFNGACSLFWVMAESFIRKNSPKGSTSATFGLYVTFQKLAFVIAPLIVVPLVLFAGLDFQNLHWLLLILVPFSIAGAFIISRVGDEGEPVMQGVEEVVVRDRVFKKEFEDLKGIGIMGYLCLALAFFMRSLESIVIFLIPLYALSISLGLIEISLLFAAICLPFLLSFFLAELSDRFSKAGTISIGFACAALTLLVIAFSGESHALLIAACFALGLLLAIIQPAVNGLMTDITPRVNDGEITGLYTAVLMASGFLSATAFGLLSGLFGLSFPFVALAAILMLLAISTFALRSRIVVRI